MKPVTPEVPTSQLRPLDVKCSDTRCNEGYHYYTSEAKRKSGNIGDCKKCGDNSVDWNRLHKRDLADVRYTFEKLKRELLRHVCWENNLGEKVFPRARKRGRAAIIERARQIINKKIVKVPTTFYDNMCTPKDSTEIIHYAQHATATCCRKCLDRWHNIPKDVTLSEEQVNYCVDLITLFIDERLPDLKELKN